MTLTTMASIEETLREAVVSELAADPSVRDIDHRLRRPTAAERDDRRSRCHGLERRDAEILFAGEDKCPAAGKQIVSLLLADLAQKLHIWAGERL